MGVFLLHSVQEGKKKQRKKKSHKIHSAL